jgi:hypothetical protein
VPTLQYDRAEGDATDDLDVSPDLETEPCKLTSSVGVIDRLDSSSGSNGYRINPHPGLLERED